MVYTRKLMHRCPVVLGGCWLSYVARHRFLGVVLYHELTFMRDINRTTDRVNALIQVLRYMVGTSWGRS